MIVLMSVGLLILIFSVINYINLTVAQAGFRAKEMATRRLLGSLRGELFMRLMLESTLLTFISLIIGVLLALAVVPFVNDLLQTRVDMNVLGRPVWLLALVSLTVAVGVLSGLLPAIIISSSKPIEVVRGTFRAKTKMVFSKFFIVFQNVITITMIAASITMVCQIVHMINAPVGYKTKNLLAMRSVDERQLSAFVGELKGLSCVDRVGKTQGLPLFGSNNWTATYQGQNISFQQFVMDKECYDMLGLEILRDNHLTTEGWFLNEQAMREMNLSEDAASFMLDRQERPIAIAGIVRDFYCFGNVTTGMNPVMFRFLKDNEDPWMILIETQGDPFAAKEAIGKVYEKVTGLEFEAYFMDERLQNSFDSQIRLAKIVIVFSIIAILISLLGLLAMSTYFIQQRLQEVSVRKVFGSSNRQILVKLVFTFLNYVLIAFVIAIPIIMYFMKDWLSDYSYRIGLSPLIFIAAGLFCLMISFVSLDPENKEYYQANYEQLTKEIGETEKTVSGLLHSLDNKTFIIYHPALTYLANEYGLTQLCIEMDGKEPSPAQLKELVETAREHNAKVVFIQREFDQKNAELIAKETGCRLIPINPLDYDWSKEMIHIAKSLADGQAD